MVFSNNITAENFKNELIKIKYNHVFNKLSTCFFTRSPYKNNSLLLFSDFRTSTNPLRIPKDVFLRKDIIWHPKIKVQSHEEQYGNISI